jgi:hypothetical protein
MHAIESKAHPSPPEPTMRQERTVQATIFEVFAGHEIGCELKAISQWLDRQRALVSLVAGDLRRHVPPRQVAADGGYASQHNLTAAKARGVNDVAFHKKRWPGGRRHGQEPLGLSQAA